MPNKNYSQFSTGSLTDSELILVALTDGTLSRVGLKQAKDYFLTGVPTSSYDPTQLNLFSSSILVYTAAQTTQIQNTFASESNYLLTASFHSFSSSYVIDSASFLSNITAATYNPAQLNLFSASILTYTGSINTQISNVFASQSKYALSGSGSGIDTVIGVSQSFTTNRLINANGFSLTLDSASSFIINTNGVPQSSSNEGIILENKTPVSSVKLYEYSPSLHWKAHVFNTTDKVVEWRAYSTTEKQGMSFKGDLVFENQLAGGGWSEKMRIASNTGIVTSQNGFLTSGSQNGVGISGVGGANVSCTTNLILTLNEVNSDTSITTPTTVITSGSITLIMPSNASSGGTYHVMNAGTGLVTLSASLGLITNGITSGSTYNLAQGKFVTFVSTTSGPAYYLLSYN